jgi:P-loop containing NTP hydrolase pore-1/C-terminal domain on Strawberry notch homologue
MATEFINNNDSNSQQSGGANQSADSFVPPAETGDLLPGTFELISELQRRLMAGESFNNPRLTELASQFFGGGRMEGKYSPKDAYDALEVAVNRLLLEGDARALMGMTDPSLGLAHVLRPLLKQLPRQVDRTLEQQLLQQFSSPPTLAYVAARVLNPNPSDIVMEPSAGTASLAIWALAVGAQVITNEISPRRRALLELLGFSTMALDAEYLDDLLPGEIKPTAALMNPPFSATGGRVERNNTFYGARHFETMLKRLETGGRLTGISGQGMGMDKPTFSAWWRAIAAKYTVRANLSMPGDEYAKMGTTFDNQLIVIDKTGPTPGKNWDEQLRNIRYGQMETLEQALEILAPIAVDRPEIGEVRTKPSSILIFNPQPQEFPKEEETVEETVEEQVQAAPSIENQTAPVAATTSPQVISITSEEDDETIKPLDDNSSDDEKEDDAVVFVPYKPAMLTGGVDHPADIVEAASMGAIQPPPITYRPHLPHRIVSEGLLSNIQLERVIYAGQAHEQRLPNGARGGFFVGDGTGVGKGRILAGIIVDNWFQGRRRALWLSVNNDLMDSALRDLTDLGVRVPLARINDYLAIQDITLPEGVIFSSYSSLISSAKSGERRLDQIQKWLGEDGIIILDESHKAKNALASGRGEPTQTGQAVIDLQDAERNPDYRIVYSSATGATDVRNMAYMTRLGLWGDGTSFSGGFSEFMVEIDSGGVGAMEMVARDLKALGKYASGSISFTGVEYREVIHYLSPQQRQMYDQMAGAWQIILQNIHEALAITNGDSRAKANAMTKFWGDHQRCCRQVISAFKVPTIIKEIERALSEDHSVVISLIGTGEARTKEQISKQVAAGGMIEDLDFGPRESICGMVDRGFPVNLYQEKTDPATGQTIRVPVLDDEGKPVQSKEALMMKQRLLDSLSSIELPEHPLDQIINYFGEKNVAELTGRKRRLIRNKEGRLEYVKRAPEGVAMDKTNLHEMALFQKGTKRIAIISDAASTGISLHADRRGGNQQRREHMTLELNWSADKQMQTFGRTHRSNQAMPPIYILLSTELGGEKRFSSTIARRLGSLGALTKGDRGAADGGGDLCKYNFETDQGTAALKLLYTRILENNAVPGIESPRQTLRDMGLLVRRQDGTEEVKKEDLHNIPRFLNRVLALDVTRQNAMFDYFADLFEQTVRFSKANGTFDEGVTDIKATAIRLGRAPKVVHEDTITGAKTTHYTLEVDQPTRPVSFKDAKGTPKSAFYKQKRSGHYILAVESGSHTDPDSGASYKTYAITKPEASRAYYIKEAELISKYQPVPPSEAKWWWETRFNAVPPVVTVETHIIGGAIIPLWQHLKTEEGSILKVVRVTTVDGLRIVGIWIPKTKVAKVLRSLGISRSFKDPDKIFTGVLEEGEDINLVGGLKLRKSFVHGEEAIELTGADPYKFGELRDLGLINEQIAYKQRFFIPTEPEKGIEILTAVLKRYPAINADGDETEESAETLEAILEAHSTGSSFDGESEIVDIDALVIEPEPDASYNPIEPIVEFASAPAHTESPSVLSLNFDAQEEVVEEIVAEEALPEETSPDLTSIESSPSESANIQPVLVGVILEPATSTKKRRKRRNIDCAQLGFLWGTPEESAGASQSSSLFD